MPQYIHELATWPTFRWDQTRLAEKLAHVRHRQGRLIGRMGALGFNLRAEAALETLTEEVIKSSEIEGEVLDKDQVRSSIASRLGMDIGALTPADRNVEGIVEMMLDATQGWVRPLTEKRLFGWHASLFPTGHSGISKITVGGWRTQEAGAMQVVSGAMGHERVHYEAPTADRLPKAMAEFLAWFNGAESTDLVLKAAIAHFWFVTIHPFEDGNGRIARAIADLMLARSERSAQRFYSMSAQIRQERKEYYNILEATQKGDLEITDWLDWFFGCLDRAFDRADSILSTVLMKAEFWDQFRSYDFNERQRAVLNRLLDGFNGKLTSSKWATLAKTSPDTALRDITNLVERGALVRDPGGGRSTSYSIAPRTVRALRQTSDYVRRHSGLFVQNGPLSMPPDKVAERKAKIEAVADRIDELASRDNVEYHDFEPLLKELHYYGFFPTNELVSTVASALYEQSAETPSVLGRS